MYVHLRKALFVLLGTAAALIACIAATQECRAQTPAQKKNLEAEKRILEAEKRALDLQTRRALDDQRKLLELQKKNIDFQNKAQVKLYMEAQKKQEAAALMSAYMLLGSANSDYAGHRERAVQHVRAALTLVDLIGMRQNEPRIKWLHDLGKLAAARPANGTGEAFESQVLSDTQLANASGILQGVALSLRVNRTLGPLGHVDNAIMEINAALRTSALNAMKGKEAELLTYAYVLLASANHDYDGRRARAMNNVQDACLILEVDILRHASVDQRIKAIADANAQALAKGNANAAPTLHENQYISDSQLLMARILIQRVGFFMSVNNPRASVFRHLEKADREIGTALIIR